MRNCVGGDSPIAKLAGNLLINAFSLWCAGIVQMLVDDIGDVTITNDGATILKMLEVEHPAAKVCYFQS